MRSAPTFLGFLLLGSLACKIDNPAFNVTEGPDGGSTAATGDASTSGPTTTDGTTTATGGTATGTATTAHPPTGTTTVPETSTSGPATTEPLTSGTGTTEATTGTTGGEQTSTSEPATSSSDGSTTLIQACMLPEAPAFDLGYSSSKGIACGLNAQSLFYTETIAADGANAWKLRVCKDIIACKDPNVVCLTDETVRLVFDGPADLVPDLSETPCHQVGMLARGPDINDPTVCRLRVVRLAHAGFDAPATDYVGAVDVPDTTALPQPWPDALPFSVKPELATTCEGTGLCNFDPGLYRLIVQWFPKNVQHKVDEGAEFGESLFAKESGVQKELSGSFHDIASRALPDLICEQGGTRFDWVWLGDIIAPGP